MAMFSEPIVTSAGIMVGVSIDGRPQFGGDFFQITRMPQVNYSSYDSNRNYSSNSKPYKTLRQVSIENERRIEEFNAKYKKN